MLYITHKLNEVKKKVQIWFITNVCMWYMLTKWFNIGLVMGESMTCLARFVFSSGWINMLSSMIKGVIFKSSFWSK